MAHHQGRDAPPGAAVKTVDIAAADAAGFHLHQEVVRAKGGLRHVHQFEYLVFLEQQSLHSYTSSRLRPWHFAPSPGRPAAPAIVLSFARLA